MPVITVDVEVGNRLGVTDHLRKRLQIKGSESYKPKMIVKREILRKSTL